MFSDFEVYGGAVGLTSCCLYGGAPYQAQESKLRRGVDIVIGTPGRVKVIHWIGNLFGFLAPAGNNSHVHSVDLICYILWQDHIERENIDLSSLTFRVLDEADEMLRMGFVEDVELILGACVLKFFTMKFLGELCSTYI